MRITIIANGLFPSQPEVLALLEQSEHIVCCDGALGKFLSWQRSKGGHTVQQLAVVGDGDSVYPAHLQEAEVLFPQIQHISIAEQEDNDLTKAVRYVMESSAEPVTSIDIFGATGLREDHTIGNISLLAYYASHYPDTQFRMISDFGTLVPAEGHARFDTHKGQQISIFSLTPQVPVSVEGLRYPISNRCIEWWWEATLNEALGDHFDITGGRLIIYLKHNETD